MIGKVQKNVNYGKIYICSTYCCCQVYRQGNLECRTDYKTASVLSVTLCMYQYLHSYIQNQITIQVQVWKTLVVSAFLGVSGHWNIEHCNIFWSVNFTLLVYFGLTFHSTFVKNFPKIFAFQSFDYAGHGPVVRRIIRLKDH